MDKKSPFPVNALIFYCPYTLRNMTGQKDRSVRSHHFLRPLVFDPEDLKVSKRHPDRSVCVDSLPHLLVTILLTDASPSPAPRYTLAHTHPTAGK